MNGSGLTNNQPQNLQMENCRNTHRKRPRFKKEKRFTVQLNLGITDIMEARLTKIAIEHRRSLQSWIREFVENGLNEMEVN